MHVCGKCGGRAVATAVLRRQASPAFLKKLRLAAYGRQNRQGRGCPYCGRPMRLATLSRLGTPLTLDVCPDCHVVWFDPKEFAQVPPGEAEATAPAPVAAAPGPAVEPVAVQEPTADAAYPDRGWKYLPGILGWPVEMQPLAVARKPVVTWAISAILVAVTLTLLAEGTLQSAIQEYGLIPSRWGRHAGMTVFYGFFLHAGLFHLISNVYFLLVFGDNVEDHLGRGKFFLLLMGAHLAGQLLHAAYDPRSDIPCVGASAGISGVIAYYAIAFPRARLGFFIWFLVHWFRIRAIWALVAYLLLQLWGAWAQLGGFTHVSYLAHLGGLGVGAAAALAVRYARVNPSLQKASAGRRLSSGGPGRRRSR